MTAKSTKPIPLVERLIGLAEQQDRAALAALRTGLGKPPGAASRMLPIVAPFLHANSGPHVTASFLTASLFAKHPKMGEVGNLGSSLRMATSTDRNPSGKHGEAGVEARLVAALDADPEDLPHHLTGLVSLCESASVPIDWHQFYRDVRGLLGDNEEVRNRIRTRWARSYWQVRTEKTSESNSNVETEV